ncbi:MAG: class I SAM-dependent methyltransferase [Chloroflexota bacterium]|nr:class I SAM-dependent methyltransferase [Chloroflexota bacterium]MDQ6906763.1 class I SAM-dependent methyltransferase [Chloroflexota bacterium]
MASALELDTATTNPAPDFAAIKAKQRQTWATGDYAVIGTAILYMAETLCEAMDLRAGQRVLDVAGGSGNAALAAARRFCVVTCTDYVPELLDRGRERAAAERLPITFEVADAEDLPYPDGSFDAVTSTVGVMFAPDQERAAAELLRVCTPGGTIGLANWTPDGFLGELFRIVGKYAPPPAGVKPAALWGTEERLHELLGEGVVSLVATRRAFVFRARSADHWIAMFREYYGPINKAFAAQDAAGQAALAADLDDLLRRHNRATDGTIAASADYLEVIATRR